MKTLGVYLGSIIDNNDVYLESLLDDDTFFDKKNDKAVIEEWINDNYTISGKLTISDDLVVDCKSYVFTKNKHLTSLTNGFRWGTVDYFYCCECDNLTSLKGAPEKTLSDFVCMECDSLESLEGAPEEVGGNFYCGRCNKLTNLIGSPKIVKECFSCINCDNLESFEGISGVIKGDITCADCKSLRDITHIKKVSGKITIQNCPNITRTTPKINKKMRIYNER